jgi:flavin reductase (DIM6/NTAB) family NADH-FMN oxidoreductase RutF/flavodoxin/rubredoxin
VQAVLKKAAGIEIRMVCPLHGFVWRKKFNQFLEKYIQWATYTPEETGVVIAYASVYGNTANAADILATRLREQGVKVALYDVSYTAADEILAAAFRYSHLVFASTTYNAGIYVAMEDLLHDIVHHNLQNRTIALIENGSWAPASGGLMRELLSRLPGTKFIDQTITVRSSVKKNQLEQIDALVDAIVATMPGRAPALPKKPDLRDVLRTSPAEMCASGVVAPGSVDANALFKLSYGLFVLSARDGDKDNGCIINTASQITDIPKGITIAVNKANFTHDMILKTGTFNVSILSEDVGMDTFKRFGFQSGRTADKFAGCEGIARSENGIYYLTQGTNALLSGKVRTTVDCGTHTLFIADVTEANILSREPSVTYAYYFDHIKPKPLPAAMTEAPKSGWVCKICGYIYEGDPLPADFICPVCKHGAEDFEKLP